MRAAHSFGCVLKNTSSCNLSRPSITKANCHGFGVLGFEVWGSGFALNPEPSSQFESRLQQLGEGCELLAGQLRGFKIFRLGCRGFGIRDLGFQHLGVSGFWGCRVYGFIGLRQFLVTAFMYLRLRRLQLGLCELQCLRRPRVKANGIAARCLFRS